MRMCRNELFICQFTDYGARLNAGIAAQRRWLHGVQLPLVESRRLEATEWLQSSSRPLKSAQPPRIRRTTI